MDSKILKSAGAAVAVVAAVCLSCTLLEFFLNSMERPYPSAYLSLYSLAGLAVSLLSTPALGFLSVYIFRKNKGDLTFLNLTVLVIAAVIAFCIITILPEQVMRILYLLPPHKALYLALGSFELVFSFFLALLPSLIGAAIGAVAALLVLTSAEEKKRWDIRSGVLTFILALVFVLLGGLVLWELGPSPRSNSGIVITGWSKLQPLSQNIVYYAETDKFKVGLMNSVGTSIHINAVTANETISGTMCTTTVEGGQKVANQTIGAGDTLEIEALCAGAGKNPQDTYEMNITVTYESILGAAATTHVESGRIRGRAE